MPRGRRAPPDRGAVQTLPSWRRPLAWGLLVALAYASLAAVSGRLSPLARGPLLDGMTPGARYNWVDPPPELAKGNIEPSSLAYDLPIEGGGTVPDVRFTDDSQLTLVTNKGTVAAAPGQRAVHVTVEPLDPAKLGDLPDDLTAFGNAYLIRVTYIPSNEPVTRFAEPVTTILAYPATPNLHATRHELLYSADGTWTRLDSTDTLVRQQVAAEIDRPGYVVVGGVLAPIPSPPASGSGGGSRTLSTVLLVLAACSLLIGIGILIRARNAQ
jgi:hypothetical protein